MGRLEITSPSRSLSLPLSLSLSPHILLSVFSLIGNSLVVNTEDSERSVDFMNQILVFKCCLVFERYIV